MHGDDKVRGAFFWHGPKMWVVSALAGAGLGVVGSLLAPGAMAAGGPVVPLWLVAPFVLLLVCIAVLPMAHPRWWHRHFPDVAFFLGSAVAAYYVSAFRPGAGAHLVLHAGAEYLSFIALVGGLFVVAGGVRIRFSGRAGPVSNALILLAGAVLSNVVGTTGASMLLIRPFMLANEGRLKPLHVVMFIFIVSNCGGCLTPIGDPPLYLGFLKGVPFFWTIEHLWNDWLVTVGGLLVVFVGVDTVIESRVARERAAAGLPALSPAAIVPGVRVEGASGLALLVLMIAGVFLDPLVHHLLPQAPHAPYGAVFQILIAALSYAWARKDILSDNEFSFFPVKEVGLLFVGIFLTMIPALGYLAAHGSALGINSPTAFYFATGSLSAVLDNAPTYLNFLQVAVPGDLNPASVAQLLSTRDGVHDLMGISTGAVFFGAMTYIGNGPNFMVRSVAEAAEVRMPSFVAYTAWALVLLLPVLVVQWALFIR